MLTRCHGLRFCMHLLEERTQFEQVAGGYSPFLWLSESSHDQCEGWQESPAPLVLQQRDTKPTFSCSMRKQCVQQWLKGSNDLWYNVTYYYWWEKNYWEKILFTLLQGRFYHITEPLKWKTTWISSISQGSWVNAKYTSMLQKRLFENTIVTLNVLILPILLNRKQFEFQKKTKKYF